MTAGPAAIALYVHWPYCARICPYCDFNVVRERGRRDEQKALVRAILADLKAQAARLGARTLVSIFFGGGTPSLMAPADVASIIEAARRLWPPADRPEITLEANPTDAEAGAFAALAQAGVDRLSLGVQAFDDEVLAFLCRNHDAAAARRAVAAALAAFPRVSLDLIYALPGQSVAAWRAALADAAATGVEHISPYQLTIEPSTAFGRAVARRAWSPPDEDLAAELYEVTQATLGELGFDAYEISNHARGPAARSRHNLHAWRGGDYAGVGPGAHGRLTLPEGRFAGEAPRRIADYIAAAVAGGLAARLEALDPRERAVERLIMGLRTTEGVAADELASIDLGPPSLARFEGLARLSEGRLVATERGRPVLDRIIAELVHGP